MKIKKDEFQRILQNQNLKHTTIQNDSLEMEF